MLPYLAQGFVLGAAAAAQPGPLQAFLLSLTSRYGWRRALPAAFAPLLSDGPILLLVLLVLTAAPPRLLHILQILGGVFLLYLAYGAFQSFRHAKTVEGNTEGTAPQSLLKGALINFLSPNPYIFWTTIAGPIFINGWREAPANGLAFLTGFYAALIGGFMAFIAIFAFTGSLDVRLNRVLSALSAVALLLFGIFQVASGVGRLIDMA